MYPVGVATQDEKLRERLHIDAAAKRMENYLRRSAEELKTRVYAICGTALMCLMRIVVVFLLHPIGWSTIICTILNEECESLYH